VGGYLVIDTSVLVATERGGLPLDTLYKIQPGVRPAVSSITVSELRHGYHRAQPASRKLSRARFIDTLLAEMAVLAFDLEVAREHAQIWAGLAERGEIIGPYDLIIAATAIVHRSPLATLNYREFQKVTHLDVRPVHQDSSSKR